MNPECILQSDVLDIIFENRNKEYGAYILRKGYNNRLSNSLIIMLGCLFVFVIWQSFIKSDKSLRQDIIIDGGNQLIKPYEPPPTPLAHLHNSLTVHHAIPENLPPQIVSHDSMIRQNVAPVLVTSVGSSISSELRQLTTSGTQGNAGADSNKKIAAPVVVALVKNEPSTHPEIMPQFPGGMEKLLVFLRNNLRSPKDLDDQEVSVKVKFVVSFDGTLLGFDVIESGGTEFDSEVIRVLKKMPKWTPGKTNGENISCWFTIPVKFIISE